MNPNPTPFNRRRFLKSAGAIAGAAPFGFPAITSCQSPNSKLNLGLIGVGGRGRSHVQAAIDSKENIVAMVDLNENNLGGALALAPKARSYADFRDFFAKMEDIDAVFVATTEHTHAFATLPPLQAGKHVYCEKPLTRDVFEARLITEAAAKAKVQTQMGTQIHASENYRRVVELIQAGAIGPVKEVHCWVSRAWGWQSEEEAKKNKDIIYTPDTPQKAMPIPDGLNWDLWIGPAPFREFHEFYFPGPRWYRWWDFGNGTMSDLGSHRNDLPWWALKLDAPLTIEPVDGPKAHHDIAPASMAVKYTYGARGEGLPPVELTWYQGSVKPQIWRDGKIPQWGDGCLFIGEEGMLLADYGKLVLLPEEKFANFKAPAPTIAPSPGQQAEWIRACRGEGPQPLCHFGYAGPLTEANHLGNVAYRAGKKLEWDAKNMKFPNAPEAEKFLSRAYREGWSLTKS